MVQCDMENVRGGSYCHVKLNEGQINELRMKHLSVNDSCYRCGATGHVANHCRAPSHSQSHMQRTDKRAVGPPSHSDISSNKQRRRGNVFLLSAMIHSDAAFGGLEGAIIRCYDQAIGRRDGNLQSVQSQLAQLSTCDVGFIGCSLLALQVHGKVEQEGDVSKSCLK